MNTWIIHRGRGKVTRITADYVAISGHILVFRNTGERHCYPTCIAVVHLAPGQWMEKDR